MTVPVGYKLLEEGEEIKSGYRIFSDLRWRKANQGEIGKKWTSEYYVPMANLITQPSEKPNDNLRDIVKSAVELYSCNILRNHVPDFKLHELKEKTGP